MVYSETLEFRSDGKKINYFEITDQVREAVKKSGISNGVVSVITPHTTCSVIYEEMVHDYNLNGFDYLQQDLNDVMDRIVPVHSSERVYNYPGPKHLEFADSIQEGSRWQCLNGDAHLRATLTGNSKSFALINGKLETGSFGYIYMVDWDHVSSHLRHCFVQIMGE